MLKKNKSLFPSHNMSVYNHALFLLLESNPVFGTLHSTIRVFPGGAVVKNPPANTGDARDAGSIPGSGRSLGVVNRNPLQYSCLGNFMERGAWTATVHGVTKSRAHSYTCRIQINIKGKKQMEICSLRICIK